MGAATEWWMENSFRPRLRPSLPLSPMVTTLRRVEPMSLAKIYAVITGALMLLFALPAGCFMAVAGGMSDELGGGMGAGLGIFIAILYPIMGVVMGFIIGWLYAFIYNLVADRVGGVELEFDEDLGAGVTF